MRTHSDRLDQAELERHDAVAERAGAAEAQLLQLAGIRPGAVVVDVGCGAGAYLPRLADAVGAGGRVIGVDRSAEALSAAGSVLLERGLGAVALVRAPAEATGLTPGCADAVFIRSVLVHNDETRRRAILGHARRLLGDGGGTLLAEPDLDRVRFADDATPEAELQRAWLAWARWVGREPAMGSRLTDLAGRTGFSVEAHVVRTEILDVARSPAWTARQTLIDAGFAEADEVARWSAAIEERLARSGPLRAYLPVHVVVARP